MGTAGMRTCARWRARRLPARGMRRCLRSARRLGRPCSGALPPVRVSRASLHASSAAACLPHDAAHAGACQRLRR